MKKQVMVGYMSEEPITKEKLSFKDNLWYVRIVLESHDKLQTGKKSQLIIEILLKI